MYARVRCLNKFNNTTCRRIGAQFLGNRLVRNSKLSRRTMGYDSMSERDGAHHSKPAFSLAPSPREDVFCARVPLERRFVSTMPRSKFAEDDPRRKRRPLSIAQKGQVLDMLAQGRKVVDVAHHFKVNESTIRTIRLSEAKVRESLKVAAVSTARSVKRSNNALLIKVDKLLELYVRRQEKAGIPVSR